MGPLFCLETSVKNYHTTLLNISEGHTSHLLHSTTLSYQRFYIFVVYFRAYCKGRKLAYLFCLQSVQNLNFVLYTHTHTHTHTQGHCDIRGIKLIRDEIGLYYIEGL